MKVSLAQAANRTGRSRSTILRTIRAGKLSAERDNLSGAWSIDMSELARVFSTSLANGHGRTGADEQMRTGEADTLATRLAAAETRIVDKDEVIATLRATVDDLRARLDQEAAERRRLTAQLTGPGPTRSTRPATGSVPAVPRRRPSLWARLFG